MTTDYSIDLTYAWAQLGLEEGAPPGEAREVLANVLADKGHSAGRLRHVRGLVEFFAARELLGEPLAPFEALKKAYRRKAMDVHPDRNKGAKASEEQFKELNAAYECVEEMHRQAQGWRRQSEQARLDEIREAREATRRERPAGAQHKKTAQPHAHKNSARKYMAASVPRSIRVARLGYLPVQTVIGSRVVRKENDLNVIFDVIMLPEIQFLRARSYLSTPGMAAAQLQFGRFDPVYTPQDVKSVTVPQEEKNPEKWARDYFIREFGLAG